MKKKITLFKSTGCYSIKEWQEEEQAAKENLLANDFSEEEISEDMIREEVYRNEEYAWEDTICELKHTTLIGNIVAIADLGFWNGRKSGYKVLGHRLSNIMTFFGCDDCYIYATKRGIYGEFYHHDGTHYVEFREFKPNVNEDRFLDKVYDNDFDRSDISRYTKNLAPYVNEVYGCFN